MDVEIKIQSEKKVERTGIIAEETYLWEATKRLGVFLKAECGGRGACDSCALLIIEGRDNLSPLTNGELEYLSAAQRTNGERLACQCKIVNAKKEENAEIILTVTPKAEEIQPESTAPRDFQKEFKDMPFNKKFATLAQIEAVALNDAVGFVTNLPYTIGGKVVDIMAKLGLQIENKTRTARRPTEHQNVDK